MRLRWYLIAFIALASSGSYTARAQTGRVTLQPTTLAVTVRPGRIGRAEVIINNGSTRNLAMLVYPMDCEQQRDGGFKFVEPGTQAESCAKWLDTGPRERTVRHGERLVVPITVQPPATASGSYHAAVMFQFPPAGGEGRAVVGMSLRFGVPITVYINGPPLRPHLTLTEFAVADRPIQRAPRNEPPPIVPTALVTLQNDGNTLTQVSGDITIRDAQSHRLVARGSVLGPNYNRPPAILRGAELDILIPLPERIPNGEYVGAVHFEYGDNRRLMASVPFTISEGKSSEATIEAQTQMALTVEPEVLRLNLPPGARRTVAVSINNLEASPVELSAALRPLGLTPDGKTFVADEQQAQTSIADYVEVRRAPPQIRPGREAKVLLSVAVPRAASAPPCGLLELTVKPEGAKEEDAASYHATVLLRRTTDNNSQIRLQSAEYRPPGIEGGGGRIEVSLSSDAAAYAELFGEVTIRNQEDTVVATHPISRNNSLLILPGGQRTVVIALGQKPPPGQYEVVLNVRVEDGGPVEEQSVELVIPPEPEQPPGVAEEQGAAQT